MSALAVLNDIREAAWDSVERRRKLPALLLLYSFIDICASLASENGEASNSLRFTSYLTRYGWEWYEVTVDEFWAARSSLLHAFSAIGWHTKKSAIRPIFYYAAPEDERQVRTVLDRKGYTNYVLLDISTVQMVAISCFNRFWERTESDDAFGALVAENSRHLLMDLSQHAFLEDLARETGTGA